MNYIDVFINISQYNGNGYDFLNLFSVDKYHYNALLNISKNINYNCIFNKIQFNLVKNPVIDEKYKNMLLNISYKHGNIPLSLLDIFPNNIVCIYGKLDNNIRESDIKRFYDLKYLDISGNKIIDNLSHLTKLEHLNISQCKNITDNSINKLINLKYLDASQCDNITDNGIINMTDLEYLDIAWCYKDITDVSIYNKKKLKFLNISHCYNYTDYGLKNLDNLETLIMKYCDECFITNETFKNKSKLKLLVMYKYNKRNITNINELLPNCEIIY